MTSAAPATSRGQLVVVGASAGGVEALSLLVSTLQPDFPAPLVLAQHLDPTRHSNLDAILRRRTTLDVVLVEGRTLLEPGKIYVVPANRHVGIDDGHVLLETDHQNRPRPSIDLLLSTAAAIYGEDLIAVILTGSGSDGAAGAVDVSSAGGVVIIQNPLTALYPSMPLALPPTAVDHVADLEQIGPLLSDILAGHDLPAREPEVTDPLQHILEQVNRRASLDFRRYKPSTILRRIGRRMTALHSPSLGAYNTYVEGHPEEIGELVSAFLIKVTEFFRDPEAFAYLRENILARLIEHGSAHERTLRIWSAGCASGEEAYSLGLLLADMLGPSLPEWDVKIFATDVDEPAIDFARRGLYPANLLHNLPDNYLERYFVPADGSYRIGKTLRQMIIFGRQDLARGVPFPRIDLVVCRNVLIYFRPELQQSVLDMFAYSLHPSNGYLFLGQAETVRPARSNFELVSKRWKVYRCLTGPLQALKTQVTRTMSISSAHRARSGGPPVPPDKPAPAAAADLETGVIRHFNEWIVRSLPAGVVVIDHAYRILAINATARRLLAIRETGTDLDFLHAARGLPYGPVRQAIDTVFREKGTVTLAELERDGSVGGDGHFLTLNIALMHMEANMPDLAVISVIDTTEQVQTRRRLETLQTEQKQTLEELQAANRRLADLNKELQDANEELQAANEEMMLTQEELQATNEEFEATNEELQATNEELETSNEELQASNEELETTNEELTSRTTELQDLTQSLTDERIRLAELIELAPFYILVLQGPHLTISAFNPRAERLIGGPDMQGRPLEEALQDRGLEELVAVAQEVYRQNIARTTTRLRTRVPAGPDPPVDRSFVYTLVPAHKGGGRVDGVVIYGEDVSDLVTREAEEMRNEFLALAGHELRTPLVPLRGYADMLSRLLASQQHDPHWEARLREYTARLDGQVRYVSRLVDDLFDIARLQNGKFVLSREPVDLVPLLKRAVEQAQLLSAQHTIHLDLAAAGDSLEVQADEGRLMQVLLNLLQNAIQYAPDSRRIDVRLRRVAAGRHGRTPGGHGAAEIAVQDYGPGIPAAEQADLFTRFYQIPAGGSHERRGLGLGLYLARNIVEQHGGTIAVESSPGQGSTFLIRLPHRAA
ncbi:MAG TPA: CheR family methyltransferase [Chloroflexia bacterium]|nr:CheR family methyltransferase [Chloroflexia bacterium]